MRIWLSCAHACLREQSSSLGPMILVLWRHLNHSRSGSIVR
jgi:hypothetical protein